MRLTVNDVANTHSDVCQLTACTANKSYGNVADSGIKEIDHYVCDSLVYASLKEVEECVSYIGSDGEGERISLAFLEHVVFGHWLAVVKPGNTVYVSFADILTVYSICIVTGGYGIRAEGGMITCNGCRYTRKLNRFDLFGLDRVKDNCRSESSLLDVVVLAVYEIIDRLSVEKALYVQRL